MKKTFLEILQQDCGSYPLREIIDNLTDDQIIDAVEEYADQYKKHIPTIFTVFYHSSFAVFDKREYSIFAEDENDLLEKFWRGKNKESWEIDRIEKH